MIIIRFPTTKQPKLMDEATKIELGNMDFNFYHDILRCYDDNNKSDDNYLLLLF